jgi:hypothetical protein
MYTKESLNEQLNLFSDKLLAPFLDPENELFKIAKALDWVMLSDKLSEFYSPDNGRPTKPSRLKIGLLVLKHLYKLSDKDTLKTLKENIYAQYLCNISLEGTTRCLNSSTLTYFRKQIGLKGIKFIEEEVLNSLKRAKLLKNKILVCDTTVVPANINYPTDISLLEKVRAKAVGFLGTAKEFGAKAYRTYKRTAKRVFIRYQKIRHHTVKFRRKTQKQLRQFAQRNLRQLKEALSAIEGTLKKAALDPASSLHKAKENLVKETKDFLATAGEIIRQQKDIYQNLPVKERIVSLDKPYLRPMVRGKYPVEVEFGPKILLNLKNNFLFLEHLSFNNVSDSHLLDLSLKGYRERFGSMPSQLAADRGFWSKENRQLAENYGIKKIAIENKGKSSYLKGKPFRERLRRLRCSIEAKISLSKRKYGLDRTRYTMPQGEEMWVRLGLIAMNLKTSVGYG